MKNANLNSRSTDPSVMQKYPADPEQTADVQELLESSEAFNPNVGVTIAPMSETGHRRQPSNISKSTTCVCNTLLHISDYIYNIQ